MSIDLPRYNDILNRLVAESVACSPPSWKAGTLSIQCDGRAIHYQLKNASEPAKATLSDALRARCEELYVAMRSHGNLWTACAVDYCEKEPGSWGMTIRFEYPPKPGQSVPPPVPPPIPPPLPAAPRSAGPAVPPPLPKQP